MPSRLYADPARVLTRSGIDDRICMHTPDGARTWRDFLVAVESWRLAILESGARRVAVFSPNLFEMASGVYGAWAAGALVVFPANTSEAMVRLLAEGAADALIGQFETSGGLPVLAPAATDTPCRMEIDDQLPCELYTSGSTGIPAGIPKVIRKLFYEVENIDKGQYGRAGELPEETVVISSVSAQHIYGLLFYMLWPLAAARPAWGERLANPEAVISVARRFEKLVWITSPALLQRLPDYLDWASARGRICRIFTAGGPIDAAGIAHVNTLTGISPVEVLGSSEAGGIACRCRVPDESGNVPDEPWSPLPLMTVKTLEGLLWVKSPQLETDGWMQTGDRAEMLPDGRFRHYGRADRVAKIAEKRVSLTGIETLLVNTGLVAKARAFQLADAKASLAVVAVPAEKGCAELLQHGKKSLVDTLKTALLTSFERVCLPRYWRFVQALPEDHMGKTTLDVLTPLFDARTPQWVLQEKTGDAARGLLLVSANAPFFKGHFDGFPILPGLAQTQWLTEIACRTFGIDPMRFSGIRNLKFSRPVRPGETLLVEYTRQSEDAVAFTVRGPALEQTASGKLIFEGAAA